MNENVNPAIAEGANQTAQGNKPRLIFTERFIKQATLLYFVALWAILSFLEYSQLHRIQDLSLFLQTDMFFAEAMKAPGGLISYAGAFLVQF